MDNDDVMVQHSGEVGEEQVVRENTRLLVSLEPGKWIWFKKTVADLAI